MSKARVPGVAKHPLSELDSPVLPTVASRMKVDILVNEQSEIWLLYDTPFAETVKWTEYDLDTNKVWLVLLSGRQQELGLVIPREMRDFLQYGHQIYLVQMQDKKIADCGIVPLMVRGGLLN